MRRVLGVLIGIGAIMMVAGCGGSKSGAARPSRIETRFDFGRSPQQPFLMNVITDVLRRYTYQLHSDGDNFIETEWLAGEPDEQEREVRITEIRHRAMVTITNRRALVTATLRLYYEVRHGDGPWLESPPSPGVIQQIKNMQSETKRSLSRLMPQEF